MVRCHWNFEPTGCRVRFYLKIRPPIFVRSVLESWGQVAIGNNVLQLKSHFLNLFLFSLREGWIHIRVDLCRLNIYRNTREWLNFHNWGVELQVFAYKCVNVPLCNEPDLFSDFLFIYSEIYAAFFRVSFTKIIRSNENWDFFYTLCIAIRKEKGDYWETNPSSSFV